MLTTQYVRNGIRPRRVVQGLALTPPSMLPSAYATASAPGIKSFAAQWLAYALPCRRFTVALTDASARLGADVDVAVGTGVTSRPPRRSRRAAFPHRAPAGSQAWSMFGAWAAHTVSTRGPMPRETCLVRLCVRGMRRHRPLLPAGSLPPHPPPPLLAALF